MADTSMQYADDRNLGARQRFWAASRREPDFDLYRWVLELAGLDRERDADVVDVGCGNGPYEDLLVGGGHRGAVVAIDASLGMLRTLGDGIARVQADAHDLPLADAVVDVALAPHVLYHVADVGRAAAELRRVLRPGGVLVAVTNGADNIRPYVELANGWTPRPARWS
jgi:ubiquinone/menaquinone biosynthesis C-methylase UbiE